MDAKMAECQQCGRSFASRIGEQFCSPAHAREFFSKAVQARDQRRKSDNKPGLMTARHRVMELLRLPSADPEPPPPSPLVPYLPSQYEFQPPERAAIAIEPVERSSPMVIKLPEPATNCGPDGVQEGLAALNALISEREPAEAPPPPPGCDTMLPLPVDFTPIPGALQAVSAAAAVPVFDNTKPSILAGEWRDPHQLGVAIHLAGSVNFFHPKPISAGARIVKTQPMPTETEATCIPPRRKVLALAFQPELSSDRLYALEPFRRTLANPVFSTGQYEQLTGSGQHRVTPTRWEFLHELPEDSRRSRQPERRKTRPVVNQDSVSPWLLPLRPRCPEFRGDLHPFDWAQLIARLADFEDRNTNAGNNTNKYGTSTTMLAAAARRKQERLHSIPVVGPVIRFWQTQSVATRALALSIPILGFIAIKPSLDGSLREPVVLAKEMPRPVSTVVRREPSRELIALRGQIPPIPDGLPKPSAPTLRPESDGTPDSSQPHPKLVPDRASAANKAAGVLPVATVEPKLGKFDQILLSRAAVELADDFSFGLDSWEARSNSVQWTYDATGFVRPRGLAIYRPSLNLADYSVEFLAKIDNSAISWVVRAQDLNNYMVVKMVQRGGGPLPRYTIMHYPVVNGREGARIEHPLPLNLYKDTLFHIRMDIRGSNYAVLVQDSVVDSWSDERFPVGGVGFFTGAGEEARIRWVQVTYQNDFVGKLCAWLAPKAQVR
jgi:hypothetical protein